jgi:thiamine-monophosphate kinase
MGIQKLTEKDLISTLRKRFFACSPDVILGIGDDAAVVKIANTKVLLAKDLLIEDHHFRITFHPPALLGRKSLNVNLSDIAAMGGRPHYALLGLGIPARTKTQWVDQFLKGLMSAVDAAEISLVGGDISQANKIIVSISIVGTGRAFILRSGARPGDRIFVSGPLGNARQGLLLLKKGVRLGQDAEKDVFIRSFLDPEPRLELGHELSRAKIPSAMIDISDGLSVDLHHICRESGVGAEIDRNALPVSSALQKERKRYHDLVLHGGEDYELLFTVPPRRLTRLSRLQKRFDLTEIGRIIKGKKMFLIGGKSLRKEIAYKGFQHFSI